MANRFKVPIRVNVDTAQLKALVERIQGLDKRAGRAAVRKGLNEITQKVLWSARGHVRRRSGALGRSLGRKVIVAKGGAKMLGIVKPRSGAWVTMPANLVMRRSRTLKNGKSQSYVPKYRAFVGGKDVNPIRYAHLVEFGRVYVTPKKKKVLSGGPGQVYGTAVRAVPPRPFMRPAWSENEASATPALHRWLSQAVADYWAKTKSKTPRARRAR